MDIRDKGLLQRPLRFQPIGKDYLWGGCRLNGKFGNLVEGDRLAEVWLLSGHAAGLTTVAGGPLKGQNLPQLLNEFGAGLGGTRCGLEFPLLFKLLDVEKWLSVQVHPSGEKANSGESFGKTELWITLEASANSQLLLGLQPGVDRSDIVRAGPTAAFVDLLQKESMEEGHAFYVPAGVVHALGPGSLVLEIQESSDTTYRLYDWDRPQDHHRPRPIHWQNALEVLEVESKAPGPVCPQEAMWQGQSAELLGRCRTFEVFRLRHNRGVELRGSTGTQSMEVLVVLNGKAELIVDRHIEVLRPLDCVLLPAAMGSFTIQAETNFEYVAVQLPGLAVTSQS